MSNSRNHAWLMLFAAACTEAAVAPPFVAPAPPAPPVAPVPVMPADAPAFIPKMNACRAPYAEQQGVCVHAYYRANSSPAELERQLAMYGRGAVSPKADGRIGAPSTPSPGITDPSTLDPSALTKVDVPAAQAGKNAEQARVKALDALLASVRESVVSARVDRLPSEQAAAPGPGPGGAGASALPRSNGAPSRARTQQDRAGAPDDGTPIAIPPEEPDDGRTPSAISPDENVAGAPDRELGLGSNPARLTPESSTTRRLSQIRQIQTLLSDIPSEQRAQLIRKLETAGARTAVGDETWDELVTQNTPR